MEGRRSRSRAAVDVQKAEIKAETPQPTTIDKKEEGDKNEDDNARNGRLRSNGCDNGGFLPVLRGENKRKRDPRGGPTRNLKQKGAGGMENDDDGRKTEIIRDEEVSNLDSSGGKDEEDTGDVKEISTGGHENKEIAGEAASTPGQDWVEKRRESSRPRVRPSKFRESIPIGTAGKAFKGEPKAKNDIFSSLEIVLPINAATPNVVLKDQIHRPAAHGVHDEEVQEAATIKTAGKKKESGKGGKSLTLVNLKDKEPSTSAADDGSRSLDRSRLKTVLGLLKRVMKMNEAEPFNEPVDPVALGIPDYFTIVKNPMDLGTIRNRLEEKGEEAYRTVEEVLEDVALVWSNCRTYNSKGDPILDLLCAVEAAFSTLCLAVGFSFPSSAPENGNSSMKTSSEQQRESQNPKKKKKKKVASWLKTKVKRSAPVEQVMAESKAREQKELADGLEIITEQLKDFESIPTVEQAHAISRVHVDNGKQEMENLENNNHDKMDSSPGSLQAKIADSMQAEGKDLHFPPHVNTLGRPRKSNVAATHKPGCLCVICGGTRHKLRGRKKKGRIPIQNETIFRKKQMKIPKAARIQREADRATALEDVDGGEDFIVENHSEHLFEACPSSENAQGYYPASYRLPPQRLTPAVDRMTHILFGSSIGSIWNQLQSLGYIPLPVYTQRMGLLQAVNSLTLKK